MIPLLLFTAGISENTKSHGQTNLCGFILHVSMQADLTKITALTHVKKINFKLRSELLSLGQVGKILEKMQSFCLGVLKVP